MGKGFQRYRGTESQKDRETVRERWREMKKDGGSEKQRQRQ